MLGHTDVENIKFFVMDVDGTLTDGMVYLGNEGELFKAFNVKDGYAIHYILPYLNIIPVIITGRNSRVMEQRCRELEIDVLYQGVHNKTEVLNEILKDFSKRDGKEYTYKNVVYIGDDLNDYVVMKNIKNGGGLVACPSDAVTEVKQIADFVASNIGGNGAVRDLIDILAKDSDYLDSL
jgi:3-deoxy-D-manno-octulosonate 8-phosphate phosphatase (KDO 8-P phosphatase)